MRSKGTSGLPGRTRMAPQLRHELCLVRPFAGSRMVWADCLCGWRGLEHVEPLGLGEGVRAGCDLAFEDGDAHLTVMGGAS